MPPDPVAEALASLIRQRDERTADHQAEMKRFEDAIAALRPFVGSSNGAIRSDPQARPSVRTMLLNLLRESDRDWSTAEILTEYERRGTPVHGKDPNNALRAAIADAYKVGQIKRTTIGRYKAAEWPDFDPWTTTDEPEGSEGESP